MKYEASKRIRPIIKHIDGAWVRTWRDGVTWAGVRYPTDSNMRALFDALDGAGIKHEPWPHRGTSGWGSTTIIDH